MGPRMRMLLSVTILAGVVGWIVLSYLPATLVSLPQFHYAAGGVARYFPGIMVFGFLAFLALQLWLVGSTVASVREYELAAARQVANGKNGNTFDLRAGKELFLTALPIVFTLILGLAAMSWWQRLAALP